MKSLVESILDVDDNIAIGNEIAGKVFHDKKILFNTYVGTTDYTNVNLAEFIDYKKLMKEVQYMTKYGGWEVDKRYGAQDFSAIVAAFINQPLLGYEQNFLAYIKNFAKGEVTYSYEKSSNKDRSLFAGKDRFTYIFKGKGHDLEVEFVVKDR